MQNCGGAQTQAPGFSYGVADCFLGGSVRTSFKKQTQIVTKRDECAIIHL